MPEMELPYNNYSPTYNQLTKSPAPSSRGLGTFNRSGLKEALILFVQSMAIPKALGHSVFWHLGWWGCRFGCLGYLWWFVAPFYGAQPSYAMWTQV